METFRKAVRIYRRADSRAGGLRSFLLAASMAFVLTAVNPGVVSAAPETAPGSPAARVFDSFYDEIAAAAADARLPEGALEKAKEIRFELEKDLIRADAEIRILKLEVVRASGEGREDAIDRLLEAAAEREMQIYRRIRALEELAGAPVCGELQTAEGPDEEPSRENRKTRIRITWEPEDLVDDVKP